MRISDWSSDVCSSDLVGSDGILARGLQRHAVPAIGRVAGDIDDAAEAVDRIALDQQVGEGDRRAYGVASEGLAWLCPRSVGNPGGRRRHVDDGPGPPDLLRGLVTPPRSEERLVGKTWVR